MKLNLHAMPNLLTLTDVHLDYGTRKVLRGVTASIRSDDYIVLTGPNGGGKTTLLRLMAGLLKPTAGNVERAAGLRIGYLPQYRRIDRQFPITVRQVVHSGLLSRHRLLARPRREDREYLDETMKKLRLAALVDRPIATLSGGQWQRVLLARALVGRPDLLLLDEPDTHLDRAGRDFLYALLEKERTHCAIVLVSHDASLRAPIFWEVKDGSLQPATVAE